MIIVIIFVVNNNNIMIYIDGERLGLGVVLRVCGVLFYLILIIINDCYVFFLYEVIEV